MIEQSSRFFKSAIVLVLMVTLLDRSFGVQYMVGDSVWSIPPIPDFYANWSSSLSFQIGDTLFFDFDSELHNVMQVSRREFDTCTASHPYKAFTVGPVIVPLIEQGVFYFICSVSKYCALGQKLAVTVHQRSPNSAPTSLPSPSSVPISQSSVLPDHRSPPSGDDHANAAQSPAANAYSSQASVSAVRSVGVCYNEVLSGWAATTLCLVICLFYGWCL
ncbi:hypothetical protein F0562_032140 [Nyssa sinensis]|uniref:Phytocyanin domain-containing protein n=1 Tax=Nyssa sinensis TaxID=561372 RepID=A0A5J5B031_9ASTE|nr:hypothetical protein F0562_032140 [Nyssa sinensis]